MHNNNEIIKNFCTCCKRETNHKILYCNLITSPPEDQFDFDEEFMVVSCQGCDYLSFRTEYSDETMLYDHEHKVKIYPYTPKYGTIEDLFLIPSEICSIYNETLDAMVAQCFRLSASGFRAVIESICAEKGINKKSLDTKINALKTQGYITKQERDRLHSVRFLGNDSIHSIKEPTLEQLLLVLTVIESLLSNLYIIDHKLLGKLDAPADYKKFEQFVSQGLQGHSAGEILTLKEILPKNKLLIGEDLPDFESKLIDRINAGEFKELGIELGGKFKVL